MVVPPFNSKPWVLITGASSGIGEVFAKRFSREGWNTVLVARSRDQLNALARILEGANGTKTVVILEDLTDPKAPHRVYEEVNRNEISLEALVNNAGFGFGGKFVNVPTDRLLGMIDLNVRALVELSRLFLPEMIQRKHGLILNVSSTASFQPLPYSAVYAATKSFVTSFTEALWLETRGTGVRVLNLCPGVTKTNFGVHAGSRDFRVDPWAEEPDQVVETAFRVFRKRAPTVISGWRNQLLVLLERFVPHRLLLRLVLVVQKMRGPV